MTAPRDDSPTTRLVLSSAAFAEGTTIPARHTCEGENLSPALAWTGVPVGTRSFALICDDPDAPRGTWVHWVLYNLPPATRSLAEAIPPEANGPDGSLQGRSSFNRTGYGGPCPPPGGPHRYFFRLHALDSALNLPPGVNRSDLEAAMAGHVLGHAVTMGTYERRKR
jgi:Raf kinase inhibitor-like YbhB/YbcL family protein